MVGAKKPSNVFLFPTGKRLDEVEVDYIFVALNEMLIELDNISKSLLDV